MMLMSDRGAQISECGKYRYALHRIWDRGKPLVAYIGLNPSTADAMQDDPTIRRCINFARGFGFGGLCMLNLFAYRATDPSELLHAHDPVGPENDEYLVTIPKVAAVSVVCWGTHGALMDRDLQVTENVGADLMCFGTTKEGFPRHPLYLPKNTTLRPFSGAREIKKGKRRCFQQKNSNTTS